MKDSFVSYMARTRDYYRAQGFTQDYTWAHNEDIPFSRLSKPLADCTVALVTTAVTEPSIPKPIRTATSYPYSRVPEHFDTEELSWDKDTTHTRDRESYFPLATLQSLAESGHFQAMAPRYHFVPTEYSHRLTIDQDAPATVTACIEDEVDIAILVPL
jgi:hypothetical protein